MSKLLKLTKAQLVAEIEALRAQLDTQHIINRQFVSDMATARALIANAQPSPNLLHTNNLIDEDDVRALHSKPAKPAYVKPHYIMPAWQQERAAAMAEAKAYAMASGNSVRVQS